jgi:hypothetical protein
VTKLAVNPYRAALMAARAEVMRAQTALRGALVQPRRTLARSWSCPAADRFGAELLGVERAALRAIEESLSQLDAKIREQPELVTEDAWQQWWRARLAASDNPLRGYS